VITVVIDPDFVVPGEELVVSDVVMIVIDVVFDVVLMTGLLTAAVVGNILIGLLW
jgi:hypothetical protein